MGLNLAIFKVINGMAHQNAMLDKLMIFMSEYGPDIFMISLALLFIMGLAKKNSRMRGISVDTFIIIVLNLFIGYVIGAIWYIPRPFVNNKVNLLIPHTMDASFPSDHAVGTMSIAVGISKNSKIYGVLLTMLSILVGISRVFVGHHYPADVIGGYAIVFITNFLYNRFLSTKVQDIYFSIEKFSAKKLPLLEQFL